MKFTPAGYRLSLVFVQEMYTCVTCCVFFLLKVLYWCPKMTTSSSTVCAVKPPEPAALEVRKMKKLDLMTCIWKKKLLLTRLVYSQQTQHARLMIFQDWNPLFTDDSHGLHLFLTLAAEQPGGKYQSPDRKGSPEPRSLITWSITLIHFQGCRFDPESKPPNPGNQYLHP